MRAIFESHFMQVALSGGSQMTDVELTAEFENFYLVCCYTPNSQRELARLAYRMTWEDALREYLVGLDKVKPVIYCGDLNVAHNEIDLKNPKTNRKNAGFTDVQLRNDCPQGGMGRMFITAIRKN